MTEAVATSSPADTATADDQSTASTAATDPGVPSTTEGTGASDTSAEIAPSTSSLRVDVALGGSLPSDPDVIEQQIELDAYLAEQGVEPDQASALAYLGGDRGPHLVIENAVIDQQVTQWRDDGAGGGINDVQVFYLLDGAGLDDEQVAVAIDSALADAGFDPPERGIDERQDEPFIELAYSIPPDDEFTVEISGLPDDPDSGLMNGFRIRTRATFADAPPQLVAPVAPLESRLDAVGASGPVLQIETGAKAFPFPSIDRVVMRLTDVAPADFERYLDDLEAQLIATYDGDVEVQSRDEDSARFATAGAGVYEAKLDDEQVTVRLNDRISTAD